LNRYPKLDNNYVENCGLVRGWLPRLTGQRLAAALVVTALVVVAATAVAFASDVHEMFVEAQHAVAQASPLIAALDVSQSILASMGYTGLVLVLFAENVFPPIPSDIILPLAGFLVATTPMSFTGAVAATTAGSMLGALTLYHVGAWLGEARVRRFCRRYGRYLTFEEAELDRSIGWFQRHGSVVVLVAREVPVFRSLISIPAGMTGMPLGRFLILSGTGAAIWNTLLISAGFLLGSNWETVVVWLEHYQLVVIVLNVCVFLTVANLRLRRYRQRSRADDS
jgi:membrane protein DedA with SNARE-associated domain